MLKALRTHWETTPLIGDTIALVCLAVICLATTVAFILIVP